MTIDSIIDICARSAADDWLYWLYVPSCSGASESRAAAAKGSLKDHYAQALYLKDVAVGVAWGRVDDIEESDLPAWAPAPDEAGCRYHWVDLLYDNVSVERFLAVAIDAGRASLPVPTVEEHVFEEGQTLWVSRRKYVVVRLANEIDPGCSDFDSYFARSGIEVR